jgi:AcrR family transcriptional regulator
MSVAQPLDRRRRRRQETIDELLDLALSIMGETGVAGLSLGELARRLGVRPPSLYAYFPSKDAVYDALFERGGRALLSELRALSVAESSDLLEVLRAEARAFVGWCLRNPVYAQLLFWRTVPGFRPSEAAYAPAVEMLAVARALFSDVQQRGLLRADADLEAALRDWTVLLAGVVSQQLANAPEDALDTGRFTSALPTLTAMFAREYGAPTRSSSRKRGRHDDEH